MAKFKFRVQDIHGKIVEGLVEAVSSDVAADILNDKGYTILYLAKQAQQHVFDTSVSFLNRVSQKDLMIFSRQFAVLIAATIPVVQSLQIMIKQTENITLQKILADVGDHVNGGLRLSDALERHPKAFGVFFINIVRAGEMSGKLDEVLTYLANQLERDFDLNSRIRGALIYPAVILSGLIGVAVFMMISVVPKLVDIIDQAGGELPISTRILIFTSNALTNYWVLLIAITISLFFMARIYAGTNSGRRQFDMIKLYIPVFGKLFRKIYIVRFSRALNTLMVGGVNITKALDITSETVGNEIYKEILLKTSEEVTNGNSISTVFSESHLVPVMVSQIMQVGEQTGRLEEVLDKITDFYTLEIDNTVRNLVSLLEPLIIVVMGGGVGLLVASIILPIYQVATSF